ncbi:UvrD-helicase domain-containing protein [Marinobacter mangrovi]|uniref:UvrD-helicase domain-containing protein n=1 Tax=Marinobacter mangrovi TaxID=2803918 RepID=UPI0019344D4E|nr:UvrD-helicase domain-containing protein [Marinobacter mangrovi]
MNETINNPAIIAAQKAQRKINEAIDAGDSFRLEAGAGAGKTYSLVAALKRLIEKQGPDLVQAGQQVACITYTEVARNEIAQEIEDHPAILVNTIHGFSWGFLRQFQKALRELVLEMDDRKEKIEQGGGVGSKPVDYDLGFFGVDTNRVTLSHDDIPAMMARLLQNKKFQLMFAQQFPVIFIDEYQDTHRQFMEAITNHFLTPATGPLVGLFGDHWQTIYRSEYELAEYPIKQIPKGSNFRSAPAIVKVLNKLRPELRQAVPDPNAKGEARFFHTNGYTGRRTNDAHSKEDLPPDLARRTREDLMQRLQGEGWDLSSTKVLMLTHNVLAAEQGYPKLAKIYSGRNEQFAKKEDPVIKFFAEAVEPICEAYCASRYGDMFRAFGTNPTITQHSDKISWRRDLDTLQRLRTKGTVGQVIDHLKATGRPLPPDRVMRREEELNTLNGAPIPDDAPALRRYDSLRNISYGEVIELVKFVENQTAFATQHSVKGAQFENVLVVLGGGWNHYNWPQLLELIETNALTAKNTKGFYRARNLFYVSISRPITRLAVLATQTMPDHALKAINRLFGSDNVEELPISRN